MDPSKPLWVRTKGGVRLRVRVQPRSSRTRLLGERGGALQMQVSAPPVGGAANDAVIDLLAGWLSVPRRRISIVRGRKGRDKVAEVTSDAPEQLAGRLRACLDRFR